MLPSEFAHLPYYDDGGGTTAFVCRHSPDGRAMVHKLVVKHEVIKAQLAGESGDKGYDPCTAEQMDLANYMR